MRGAIETIFIATAMATAKQIKQEQGEHGKKEVALEGPYIHKVTEKMDRNALLHRMAVLEKRLEHLSLVDDSVLDKETQDRHAKSHDGSLCRQTEDPINLGIGILDTASRVTARATALQVRETAALQEGGGVSGQ